MNTQWFFTESCLICGVTLVSSESSDGICPRCIEEIRNAPGPFRLHIGRSPVVAAREYGGIIREALRAYKQQGFRRIGHTLARELLLPLARTHQQEEGFSDVIASVPAHPGNRRIRGFDQAHDLATRIAVEMDLPVERPFRRSGRTTQKSLARTAREENAQHAIILRRGDPGWAKRLQDRRFILIDDVVTTGATIHRCADLLEEFSAVSVAALVLAATL